MSLTGDKSELERINLEMVFTASLRKERREPKTKAWDTSMGKLSEGAVRQAGRPPEMHSVQGVHKKQQQQQKHFKEKGTINCAKCCQRVK